MAERPGRVVGDEDIHAARQRGETRVPVTDSDLVTAAARDSAERLGIRFVRGPLETPPPAQVDGPTVMRRALLRRGPKWITPAKPSGLAPVRLGKVAFVGAGGVGANTALMAAAGSVADEITLIDIVPGAAAATALDLTHAAGITGSTSTVTGGTDLSLVAGADIVVITAGRPRSPGMTRADLVGLNGRVIRSVAEAVASSAPDAVAVVVTNPLDEMTMLFLAESGFAPERVLGMAGTLDSARFRSLLATAADVDPDDVSAITLGSHGAEMVPIVSTATIKGRPLTSVLSQDKIDRCVAATVSGGGDVVALRRTGSATIAPAYATFEVIDGLRGNRPGLVPVSVLLEGQYGISGTVVGVPVVLGRSGVLEVVELPLSETEQAGLEKAAAAVAQRLGAL